MNRKLKLEEQKRH